MKTFPALAALAIALVAQPLAAATLRPQVVVETDVVLLGDLFADAGPRAEQPVANAPAPGRRMTLDVAWLAEIARIHQIAWRPMSRFDRAVIERAGRTIAASEIMEPLRQALEDQGLKGDAEIELSTRNLRIDVALEAPQSVEVRNLAFDAGGGRFSALLIAGAPHPTAQRIAISGRVHQTIPVPVLRRAVSPGDVIGRDDVELTMVREDGRRGILTEAAQLVGTTPRQRLRPGVPVRESDVRAPIIVERNAPVTIMLRTRNMTLTAQGRASEDGAMGEIVRVTNLQSKRIIEAEITGPGIVTVRLLDPRTLSN